MSIFDIRPTDSPNTSVSKWLVFLSLLVFGIFCTHEALGTDGSLWLVAFLMLFVAGASFRIAYHLEESGGSLNSKQHGDN